ncbi:FAD-dependent monooxygenase [Nonomuraea sp. NPDC051941]|uniref:FAD-dependent monooxygenase n=1 Tax=Nonomuraea sp. NPDC051941 TaxID=3364373 RepID=UPI0037C9822F
MNETDVIVVGAGPTGLMLACELALAGVRCRLLERRTEQPNITRAFAVHARTLELLDARDLAGDLLARGLRVHEVQPAPGATLDLRSLETRFPMILIVPQSGTEHVLEARARELGVEIVRGAEVTGIRQDARRVELDLADGRTESAAYVVGCDGAHSAVRRLIGVDFAGRQYETHILLADVRLTAPPGQALFATGNDAGVVIMVPFGDGWFRAIAWDRLREQIALTVPLPMEEMRDAFHRIAGTDFGMSEQRWSSRFRSERRQARHYRVGRVFLAGDAAHVHSRFGPTRRILAGRLTGLGIAYPAATRGAHPWTGRRMPDLACEGGRLYELLRDGCFRLVDMTASGAVAEAVASAAPEVQVTRYAGPARPGRPAVILVRPDGYVAWASSGHPDLPARAAAEAARWSGPHPADELNAAWIERYRQE